MSSDTVKNQVLSFPHSQPVDFSQPMADSDLIFQTRLIWTRIINKAVLGIRPLTDENKQCIREINAVFIRNGYEPLHSDFETL